MEKRQIEQFLKDHFPGVLIRAEIDARNVVTLSGECESWGQLIDIGHAVAQSDGVRNAVSNMTVKDLEIPQKDYSQIEESGREKGLIDTVDVVVIGAGISGCAVARELAKYNLQIIVTEAADDVGCGATKANNGCIHHGMDCKPGTMKAKLNVLGNRRYDQWNKEMDLHLLRCGCLEIVEKEEDIPKLTARYEQGVKNGVDGIRMVTPEEACEIEPALITEGFHVVAGLYMPSHGTVETPYVCVAVAENAAKNGVRFLLGNPVGAIDVEDGKVKAVVTKQGIIQTTYVVNAAGMYADDIAEMAQDKFYTIHNRLGTLAAFDKASPNTFRVMFDNLSTHSKDTTDKNSKGGGCNLTPEGNLLLGPSATEVPDKEAKDSSKEGLAFVETNCWRDPAKTKGDIIRLFAAGRPADLSEDFIIELSEKTEGFVHVAGIQSPGVASAPAIGDLVTDIIIKDYKKHGTEIGKNEHFDPIRKASPEFRFLSHEEQDELIKKDPRYGRVICRCEQITEGEIVEVLHSPVVPVTINAIKNRTRAGMGRCQGGFCQPRVLEILARELGKEWTDITLDGQGSEILLKDNRAERKAQG